LTGEIAEKTIQLSAKEAEVIRLTDEKSILEEAKKIADKNLEKLTVGEREIFNLKAEAEKTAKNMREIQAKLQFWEQQATKLKAEAEDLSSVSSSVLDFQRSKNRFGG
jgi:hypothetical protein